MFNRLTKSSISKDKNLVIWDKFLGPQIITQEGPKQTQDVIAGATAVGLLFSDGSSSACREFHSKLSSAYTTTLEKKGFVIIFVSLCATEAETKACHKGMPWALLPFEDRERVEEFRHEYSIKDNGLPKLIVLDLKTNVNTVKGVEKLENIKEYPWKPKKNPLTVMPKTFLTNQPHGEIGSKAALKGNNVGIYFADSSNPKCMEFLPDLKLMYANVRKQDPSFQIIFASSDETEADFQKHYNMMPWLSLRWEDRKSVEKELAEICNVVALPTFVVMDDKGETLKRI